MPNHEQLLIVLLPKHRGSGLNHIEELQHDRTNSGKESWPNVSFQDVGQARRRMNLVYLGLRIDLPLGRCKYNVAATGSEQLAIALQRARILGEILMRSKLKGVDENARDHHAFSFAGDPHEGQMALVQ